MTPNKSDYYNVPGSVEYLKRRKEKSNQMPTGRAWDASEMDLETNRMYDNLALTSREESSMGFLEKLKQFLMGSGGATAPPQAGPEPAPWETPIGGGPAPVRPSPMSGQHRMPDGSMMPDAAMGQQDDIGMQVQQLMKQRELMKRIAPEGAWNK